MNVDWQLDLDWSFLYPLRSFHFSYHIWLHSWLNWTKCHSIIRATVLFRPTLHAKWHVMPSKRWGTLQNWERRVAGQKIHLFNTENCLFGAIEPPCRSFFLSHSSDKVGTCDVPKISSLRRCLWRVMRRVGWISTVSCREETLFRSETCLGRVTSI